MSLLRFGVAMEKDLVEQLDGFVTREGFANRSEALRSLVRQALSGEKSSEPLEEETTAASAGVLTLVYPANRKLDRVPIAPYSSLAIQANLQLHVQANLVMKIMVLQGAPGEIRQWSSPLIRQKGVLGNLGIIDTPTLAQTFGAPDRDTTGV